MNILCTRRRSTLLAVAARSRPHSTTPSSPSTPRAVGLALSSRLGERRCHTAASPRCHTTLIAALKVTSRQQVLRGVALPLARSFANSEAGRHADVSFNCVANTNYYIFWNAEYMCVECVRIAVPHPTLCAVNPSYLSGAFTFVARPPSLLSPSPLTACGSRHTLCFVAHLVVRGTTLLSVAPPCGRWHHPGVLAPPCPPCLHALPSPPPSPRLVGPDGTLSPCESRAAGAHARARTGVV